MKQKESELLVQLLDFLPIKCAGCYILFTKTYGHKDDHKPFSPPSFSRTGIMANKEYEMPAEYKHNLAQLTECIEAREGYREQIREALARGVRVAAADKAFVDQKLLEFDAVIDNLERLLAEEYERHQAEMAREESMMEAIDKANELRKQIYIIIKHTQPHLLESFTKTLDPLLPEEREQFFDEVAILEATKLKEILNGEV